MNKLILKKKVKYRVLDIQKEIVVVQGGPCQKRQQKRKSKGFLDAVKKRKEMKSE
jgi:ATP/ADP translocase